MTAPQTDQPTLADRLKVVLRHMPAPVSVVTSFDPATREPVGLAMSAIMPLSLEPCAMAIAINRAGSSHAPLLAAGRFCINLIDADRHAHMMPFASPELRGDRFAQADWRQHGELWYIEGAPASIFCEIRGELAFGTHDLLVGEVYHLIASGGREIFGWANGGPGTLFPFGD